MEEFMCCQVFLVLTYHPFPSIHKYASSLMFLLSLTFLLSKYHLISSLYLRVRSLIMENRVILFISRTNFCTTVNSNLKPQFQFWRSSIFQCESCLNKISCLFKRSGCYSHTEKAIGANNYERHWYKGTMNTYKTNNIKEDPNRIDQHYMTKPTEREILSPMPICVDERISRNRNFDLEPYWISL